MSFTRWLRNLRSFGHLGTTARESRRAARSVSAKRFRPQLEGFEDRCLPSTFTVTNLLDTGAGSLRAAVASANANPGADTIDFAVTGTITLISGQLNITDSLTINGPGAIALTLTDSSNHPSTVFDVAGSTIHVNIHDLTIADARGIHNAGTLTVSNSTLSGNGSADGGAIYNAGTLTVSNSTLSGNVSYHGGAIYNAGTLTVNNSTLSGNTCFWDGGGIYNTGSLTVSNSTLSGNASTDGGGIYNAGTLTVSNSTLYGNSAWDVSYVGSSTIGGAIFSQGTLTITNSTISNNAAVGGSYTVSDPWAAESYFTVGASATGGGLFIGGTAYIDHSTIAGNWAVGGYGDPGYEGIGNGGGIAVNGGGSQLQLYDSILADNGANYYPDLTGSVGSLGHNLIGNSSGGSGFAATDLLDVDPRLGPLQNNGGPTQTMGLLAGSPALDAGDNAGAPAYDQRGPGFPRVLGGAIDIGAVEGETQPPLPALVISDVSLSEGNSGTTAFVFTVRLSAPSTQAVSVNYATADGTATAGSDYQAASGTLTIPAGQTSGTITVLVNGDRLVEPNETFVVNLSAPTNATTADGQGVGTILDDEPRVSINDVTVTEGNTGAVNATFTVSLSVAYDVAVTVHCQTANGRATAGSDYAASSADVTIAAGQTTKTFTALVIGDRSAEPTENFVVNLSAATNGLIVDSQGVGNILDDEPRISIGDVTKAEGKKGQKTLFTFTVTLSAAYDQPVTVSFQTVNGTATTSDQDYVAKTGTLTFAPGETTKTITIEVKGDSKWEANETFYLDLFGNSSNALITKNRGLGTILNDE